MTDNKRWEAGLDLVYLSACAVHSHSPDPKRVAAMDLRAVYEQAARHHMRAIACMALEECGAAVDEEVIKYFKAKKAKAVKTVFSYAVERERLFRFFENNGIWYMPMKGIIMQDLYPKMGMREMVDNDIFIDITKRKTIKEYMEQQGYSVECFGKDCHDIYSKAPLYNFELHVYLCNESLNDNFYEYYLDVKDRLKKDERSDNKLLFTNEDFYIYLIVHAYKHFAYSGGVGIRALMDTAVYNKKFPVLDREYISSELKKLGIYDFEENMRTLALKVYSSECIDIKSDPYLLSEEEKALLDFFIESGSFGNMGQKLKQKLSRASSDGNITFGVKIRYFFKRLFPTGVYFKENYPFFYKYKIFIPFFWLWRLISKPFTSLGNIIKEFKFISKQK